MSRKAELFVNLQHCKKNGLNLFVGPFETIQKAEEIIDMAFSNNQPVVTEGQKPIDPEKTLIARIMNKTTARQKGLKINSDGTYGKNLVAEIPSTEVILKECTEDHAKAPKGHVGRPRKNVPISEPLDVQKVTEEIRTMAQSTPKKVEPIIPSEIPDDIWDKNIVIVKPRSQATIDWLRQKGITGKVVEQVRNANEVKDAVIIGWLPPRLSVNAYCIATIDLPGLRAEQRNTVLTLQDMFEAKARLTFYDVRKHIAN
jgi:hypothetical protein